MNYLIVILFYTIYIIKVQILYIKCAYLFFIDTTVPPLNF